MSQSQLIVLNETQMRFDPVHSEQSRAQLCKEHKKMGTKNAKCK